MSETSTLVSYSGKISRAELAQIPTPPATPTHIPIPHSEVVDRKPPYRSTMGSMERMLGDRNWHESVREEQPGRERKICGFNSVG
jgi:hypothetical protein